MEIRTATLGDIDEIAALVNSAYRGESSKAGWTTESDQIGGERIYGAQVSEMILAPRSFIELGFDEDNKLLATVHIKSETADMCYLGMLTVRPTLQAKGTGKKMLEFAEKKAKELGHTRMKISVLTFRDTLIAFYERRGYVKNQKTFPFSKHAGHVGTPRVSNLEFLEMEKSL